VYKYQQFCWAVFTSLKLVVGINELTNQPPVAFRALMWLGIRKSIRPVKIWVMRCWHCYLPVARCKWFAYGPADAMTTPSSLASLKLNPEWFTFLVPAYLKCPGNEIIKRTSVVSLVNKITVTRYVCSQTWFDGHLQGQRGVTRLPVMLGVSGDFVARCPSWWRRRFS